MELRGQGWDALKKVRNPGYSRDMVSFGLVPRAPRGGGGAGGLPEEGRDRLRVAQRELAQKLFPRTENPVVEVAHVPFR